MRRRTFLKYGLAGMSALAFPDPGQALEFYPKPSDKKWAVLYGTWCGSGRDAAVWISEGMGAIAQVYDVRENPDLIAFDHVIIGGSIRSGKVSGQLQTFLKNNKALLMPKLRGYFIVCGNRQQPITPELKTAFIDNHLAKITGVAEIPAKVFPGRMTKALLDDQSLQLIENMGIPDYDRMHRQDFLDFGGTFLTLK